MKKSYNIRISYLEELLSLLIKWRDSSEAINNDIYNLSIYIKRLKRNFSDSTEEYELLSRIEEDIQALPDHEIFLPYIDEFKKSASTIALYTIPAYTNVYFRNDEAFATACDFFNEQGRFFSKQIIDFKEDAYNHLKFFRPNDYSEGEMLYLKSFGEAFVWVPNNKNITKISILIHELEHVIDSYTNADFLQNHIIRETAAMFMEMIGTDYIGKKFGLEDDALYRKLELLNIVEIDNRNLASKLHLLKLVKKANVKDDDELDEVLEKNDFLIGYAEFLEENTLWADFYYQISFMIAVELYKIYYIDKEKALSILQYIIINGTNENILDILSKFGIKLNESVKEYEDGLCKKLLLK